MDSVDRLSVRTFKKDCIIPLPGSTFFGIGLASRPFALGGKQTRNLDRVSHTDRRNLSNGRARSPVFKVCRSSPFSKMEVWVLKDILPSSRAVYCYPFDQVVDLSLGPFRSPPIVCSFRHVGTCRAFARLFLPGLTLTLFILRFSGFLCASVIVARIRCDWREKRGTRWWFMQFIKDRDRTKRTWLIEFCFC